MCGYRSLAALILVACALSACGSAPHQASTPSLFYPPNHPYWMNPFWQTDLFSAVQCVVHLPTNEANPAAPRIHGTVKFLFENGRIENPEIVVSTGDPKLDKLMLQQVITAKVPKPIGLHTDQPQEFELPLEMFTPYESFEYNIYAAINRTKVYVRDAILKGDTGNTTVDFDYLDGKALNITIAKSSGSRYLDQPSVSAISNAVMPASPPGYVSKTVPMEVIFCYYLNNIDHCPKAKNVIEVSGVRIRRTTVETYTIQP